MFGGGFRRSSITRNDPHAPAGLVLGMTVVAAACIAVLLLIPGYPPVPGWPVVAVVSAVLLLLADAWRQPMGQGQDAQLTLSATTAILFSTLLLVPAAVLPLLAFAEFVGRSFKHALVNVGLTLVPVTAAVGVVSLLASPLADLDTAARSMLLGLAAAVTYWLASGLIISVVLVIVARMPVRELPVLRLQGNVVMWSLLALGLVVAVLLRESWWYLPLAVLAVWWAFQHFAVLRRALSADVDGRTGLLRLDVLRDAALREQERSRRSGDPVSLVLIDVDELRTVNLERGYESGDAVIAGVAQAVSSRARWMDVAARVGGEEFCVLLPGSSLDEAREFGEAVQADVRAATYETPSGPVHVTVSVGVTDLRPNEPLDVALARLDLALYDAKGAGVDSLSLRQE